MNKYIGFDIHKEKTVACIFEPETRSSKRETFRTSLAEMQKWLRRARKKGDRLHLTFEVGPQAGFFYDGLVGEVDTLTVSNPSQMPWIFQTAKKNDGIDAEKQAILLSVGQIPKVHMPSAGIRQWRSLIQHRGRLVEDQTRYKNRIRFHLKARDLRKAHRSHWWSQKNREWMWEQAQAGADPWNFQMKALLRQLQLLEEQIAEVTVRLDEIAKKDPRIFLIQTVPGIGPRTAETIVAYMDDVHRFPHSKQFAAYFGVTPKLDESANTRRLGSISKKGPSMVRWYLTEGCWRTIQKSPSLAAFFKRVQHGQAGRKKVALIAVVRKVLTILYAMLKTGEAFNEELALGQMEKAA